MKELLNQVMIKHPFLVHLADFGTEGLVSELAHVVAKQNFIVGKRHQRLRRHGNLSRNLGHRESFRESRVNGELYSNQRSAVSEKL